MTEPNPLARSAAVELHPAGDGYLLCRYGCKDPASCTSAHELCLHCRLVRARARVNDVLTEVLDEYERAVDKHPPMHSPHEGISVIREELQELWDHVRADTGRSAGARHEALEVAAMAVRYILDLVPVEPAPDVTTL